MIWEWSSVLAASSCFQFPMSGGRCPRCLYGGCPWMLLVIPSVVAWHGSIMYSSRNGTPRQIWHHMLDCTQWQRLHKEHESPTLLWLLFYHWREQCRKNIETNHYLALWLPNSAPQMLNFHSNWLYLIGLIGGVICKVQAVLMSFLNLLWLSMWSQRKTENKKWLYLWSNTKTKNKKWAYLWSPGCLGYAQGYGLRWAISWKCEEWCCHGWTGLTEVC